MCPQTPILSPEYSHKAGLQTVITSIPLQVRPVIQRRPRGARYNGPDHTWALGLNEVAPWEDVAAGLRQSAESCEGCPCPLCLCRTSGCSEGLERRVASLPSPQREACDVTTQAQSLGLDPSHPRQLKLSSNITHSGVGYYAPAARTTLNSCVFLCSSLHLATSKTLRPPSS
jgi:hypothetical protein